MALLAVQYSSAVYTQRCEVSSNTSSSKTWNAKTDSACVPAQLLNHVQLFETPWPAAWQVPLSSQSRILEQVAISFFRDSSQPRNRAHVSCVSSPGRQILSWISYIIWRSSTNLKCGTPCSKLSKTSWSWQQRILPKWAFLAQGSVQRHGSKAHKSNPENTLVIKHKSLRLWPISIFDS